MPGAPQPPPRFAGRRLHDVDLSGARLYAPNLEGARLTDAWLRDAELSGVIEGLRVNGVEVAPLIRAELDRRFPERVRLRATDPAGLAGAWTLVEEVWKRTIAGARALPEARLQERVDEEWSLVETLRHLIFTTDSWFGRMVRGRPHPYHPWGVAPSFLHGGAGLGLDPAASPSLDEVLAVRQARSQEVRDAIATITPQELTRRCVPPVAPGYPTEPATVLQCLHVLLDEEWEHSRYAERDLEKLGAGPPEPT